MTNTSLLRVMSFSDPFSLEVMAKGSINSIFNRPKGSPRNPFATFGDKTLCTHYDTTYKREGDTATYGPSAVGVVEGVEPVKIFCRNKRSRALASGFLCDFHSQALYSKKREAKNSDFMMDAKELLVGEREAISKLKLTRIRLVTAGKDSQYMVTAE